jgi:hypothetical protein
MIRSALTVLALILVSGAAAGHSTAWAAGTLDQSYTAPWGGFGDVDGSYSFSQTYTAGLTGTLTEVDVPLTNVSLVNAVPDLVVSIEDSKGNQLGSTTINPAGLPNWNVPGSAGCAWTPVSVTAPQTAGKTYRIVLSSPSGTSLVYGWCGSSVNGYAGGSAYISTAHGKGWKKETPLPDLDFSTYVG